MSQIRDKLVRIIAKASELKWHKKKAYVGKAIEDYAIQVTQEVELNVGKRIDFIIDELQANFHISEKLTDEEIETTQEYLHYFKNEWLGHGVERKSDYLESIFNKLTGASDD